MRGDAPEWVVELVAKMLADDPRKRPWDGAELVDMIQKSAITTSKISTISQSSVINIQRTQISNQPGLRRHEEAEKLISNVKETYGDLDDKINLCTQAIQLDPIYAHAYAWRGELYRQKCDFDLAINDLNQAKELDPSDSFGFASRGATLLQMGELDLAIRDLNKAIELEPKNAFALASRGDVYRQKGNLNLAILEEKGGEAFVTHYVWFQNEWDKWYNQAIVDLSKAIEFNPKYARAYAVRGDVHHQDG